MSDDEFVFLLDPEWPAGDDAPPFEAVLGVWQVGDDGEVGEFRRNPDYRRHFPDSPGDPLDALLRLVAAGTAQPAHLRAVLHASTLHLAVNGDGRPLVVHAPDDERCVVVATGEPHREPVPAPGWRLLDLADLAALAGDRVVLVNPGGPAPARLAAAFLRETAAMR
ncbi:type VII secretion system-associated protein [Micromonospora sp. BRA006-A]|uniref:type VII secretion system-associated protein n=1 Tax=Micromonospora sp. BRA006-A TaxID=2962860 RepID=UPI00296F5F93|nr:type VII secretion system-associated protein [Micromonospora sp. BRA006-A]MDW3848731.1 type VII secretion system-associated protein [Micromonospora sp. BRA006-A]